MSNAPADVHDVKKEVRGYMIVFGSLAFLTILTVLISRLHFGLVGNVAIALLIATFKASLVACFFMHLISERTLIYFLLIFTLGNLFFLFGLLLWGYGDILMGARFVS